MIPRTDLAVLAKDLIELEKRFGLNGPSTDDELWDWIKYHFKVEVPRVAVCDGHVAPFQFIADIFFQRVDSAVVLANRSGSKTFSVAIVHVLNGIFKDGIELATIGAIEKQAKRAYSHVQKLLALYGSEFVSSSTITETIFKGGASLEIMPGCLPRGARIMTKNGPMRIETIVSKKMPVEVKSYNFGDGQWQWKEVTGWHNNGPTDSWLSIKLDIGCQGKSQLTATPGHRVLRPDGTKDFLANFKVGDKVLIAESFDTIGGDAAKTSVITEMLSVEKYSNRYDITVADNHNYCTATGVLISNTMNAVNGPHPQFVHFDEVELANMEVYDESRNMSASKTTHSGKVYKSQDIITSTRKRSKGPMQKLVDEIKGAIKKGLKPPYELYVWCIFECSKQAKNCRKAPENKGEDNLCNCHEIVKGSWDDGTPRTLAGVCNGKFYRSRGWIPFSDIINTFTKTSRSVWEAQQECLKPSTSNLVLKDFSETNHIIVGFLPDPANGSIYEGIDFGGENPHCCIFIQVLDFELEAKTLGGMNIRLPQGAHVIFDEVYKAGIGNVAFAELIMAREAFWRSKFPKFYPRARFADPQGKAARLDLLRKGVKTIWKTNRDVKEHIKVMKDLIDDNKLYVVSPGCKMWLEEQESWRYPDKNTALEDDPEKPVKDFDHAMDSSRYCIANIARLNGTHGSSSLTVPGSASRSGVSSSSSPVTSSGGRDQLKWTRRFLSP